MGEVILLDRELDVLRRVRKDAIKWLPAKDHRLFKAGFDTWLSRHSEEAKRQLAREFMKMTLPIAKQTVKELIHIFREWEAVEKGVWDGEVGLSSDDSGEHRECDSALPGVGGARSESGDRDGSAASAVSVRREIDLTPVSD